MTFWSGIFFGCGGLHPELYCGLLYTAMTSRTSRIASMVHCDGVGYFRSIPHHFITPSLDLIAQRFHLFTRCLYLFGSSFPHFGRGFGLFARGLYLFARTFQVSARKLRFYTRTFQLFTQHLKLFSPILGLFDSRVDFITPPIKKPNPKVRLNKKRFNQPTRLSYSGEESLPFLVFRSNRLRRSS